MERSTAFGNMSAPCSPLAAGTAEGIGLTFRTNELRQKLRENTHYLKKKLSDMGIATDSSDVPIVSLTLGTSGYMRRIQQRLSENGVLIAYIPRGPGRPNDGTLRIAIFATHTTEMLDHLAGQLKRVL
jgi:7-keto-8-aminopelargonate synthetase-like enzyme